MTNSQITESATSAGALTDEAAQSGGGAARVAKKRTARARATKQQTDAAAADAAPAKAVRSTSPANTHAGNPPLTSSFSTGKPKTAGKVSKTDAVVKLLRAAKGASVAQIEAATGWQAHSVRGILSGTVKKKLGVTLTSEVGKDGMRRYRIVATPVTSGADMPAMSATDAPAAADTGAGASADKDGNPAHPVDGSQLSADSNEPSTGG